MKTAIIWVGLMVALAGTIVFLVMQGHGTGSLFGKKSVDTLATTTAPLSFDEAIVYTCPDGSLVAAAFKTGDTTVVEVSLPNNNPVIMLQTEAASGARYITDSGLAFWEKGGVVMVENNGEVIHADCREGVSAEALPVATSTNELSGTVWVWNKTIYATGTSVEPNEPEDFVVTFADNNRFSANTDCNNVGGGFVGGTDGAISFTEMVSTLMACEGDTKEGTFVSMLANVVSYRMDDTQLILSLKSDVENGEMNFTKK